MYWGDFNFTFSFTSTSLCGRMQYMQDVRSRITLRWLPIRFIDFLQISKRHSWMPHQLVSCPFHFYDFWLWMAGHGWSVVMCVWMRGLRGPSLRGWGLGDMRSRSTMLYLPMWNFQLANQKLSSFYFLITCVSSWGDIVLQGHFQGESEREEGNYFSPHTTFAFNELFTMCSVCFCVCVFLCFWFVCLCVCMPA